MSRDDLLDANAKIMTSVCENIKKAPNALVIVVSNPLDIHIATWPFRSPDSRTARCLGWQACWIPPSSACLHC